MKPAARIILTLLVLFALGTGLWLIGYEPKLQEESVVTGTGTVTDRAMSGGVPYITVEFSDGTAVCCWELYGDAPIPDEIAPGDPVQITYGIERDRGRWVFLDIRQENF